MRNIFLLIGFLLPQICLANYYSLPEDGSNIIGEVQTTQVKEGDSLESLARNYNLGYYEILEANPNIDPLNLEPGTELVIPTKFILPDAPRQGIVVNLSELRLYYYTEDGKQVLTEPVGIGRQGWETPEGEAVITDRRENPTWTAPTSVRVDMAKRGVYVPPKVPPGPGNPLGKHAMRLSMVGYVIHGTNRPNGVGRRVSAGCIRMFPEGVEKLYTDVTVGSKIKIVDQPVKIGWSQGQMYLEVHRPLSETKQKYRGHYQSHVKKLIKQALKSHPQKVDWQQVRVLVDNEIGIPEKIS